MTIFNARIDNAPKVATNSNDELCVTMKFTHKNGSFDHTFDLQKPVSITFISAMMQYAAVSDVKKLKGRIFRIITTEKGKLSMIGHPIASKFFSVHSDEFKEISEEEIQEILVASDTDF